MTDQDLIDYYKDLLILQYRGKEKALATVDALVKMAIANQLADAVQSAFTIDSAVGVQLDVVGKIVGATRYGHDFSGPVTLDDEDFRQFISLCVVQNSIGSSLKDVQELLAAYFPGTMFVFDHLSMRINYFIDSDAIDPTLAEFFIMSGRLPKPIGVQLGSVVYIPTIDDFFGFTRNGHPAYNTTGFSRNTGFVGQQLRNGDFL